jgi:peptidoglycan/xylan/chitin deacetylase (PgdA/CDA1 family)
MEVQKIVQAHSARPSLIDVQAFAEVSHYDRMKEILTIGGPPCYDFYNLSDDSRPLSEPSTPATGRVLPLLTFHTLDARPSVIAFPPDVFARGMRQLHETGYRTLSLVDAAERVRQRASFPTQSFVVTFDDGYQTMYQSAFPTLQRYGMTATVFLTVGSKGRGRGRGRLPSLESRSMLSWDEVREMHRAGITFGAHTCTHPDLTQLSSDQARTEVADSKNIIEDALGSQIACFAYPYGRHDARVRELVRAHFICACSDKLGLIRPHSDPYALERVDAYYLRTARLFDVMLTPLFPWYVRIRSVPRRIRRAFRFR